MFKHILLPTDGSQFSQAAARRAVSFARESGSRITAFYALREPASHSFGGMEMPFPPPPEDVELEKNEARRILGFVENLCREEGVECHTLTLSNNVVHEAIIEAATQCGCDLIFMATHGRRGLRALLLGSETNKVLTHSKIPVLAYR